MCCMEGTGEFDVRNMYGLYGERDYTWYNACVYEQVETTGIPWDFASPKKVRWPKQKRWISRNVRAIHTR